MSTRCCRVCQPRQPYNIQSLEKLRTDLIHPWGLATEDLLTTSATSAPEIGGPVSEPPDSASSERVSVGLRRSSRYSPHDSQRP